MHLLSHVFICSIRTCGNHTIPFTEDEVDAYVYLVQEGWQVRTSRTGVRNHYCPDHHQKDPTDA